MKKLRLMITDRCERSCEGCCNKQFNYEDIPYVKSFEGYDEIMITGGEPMLEPALLRVVISMVREHAPKAKLYLYTADVRATTRAWLKILDCDGVCITLHEQSDVPHFLALADLLNKGVHKTRSLRCNVFKGVKIITEAPMLAQWKFKTDMEWIPNCPLPEGEELKRLPELIRYYA